MKVDENSIIEYQFIINYEKVSILQKELLNYIEENSLYLGFNQEFMN